MTRVISLLLSKELYEKGLKIKTGKFWTEVNGKFCITSGYDVYGNKLEGSYSNPSTDELLAVIPKVRLIKKQYGHDEEDIFWCAGFGRDEQGQYIMAFEDKSTVEALGKLCLWLLSNGYVYSPEKKMIVKEVK